MNFKRLTLIALGTFTAFAMGVFAMILATGSNAETARAAEAPPTMTDVDRVYKGPADFTMTVEEFADDLKANATRAEQKYSDKVVTLTGARVLSISGRHVVISGGASAFTPSCYFREDALAHVTSISVGDTVNVKGIVGIMNAYIPELQTCIIVP